MKVILLEDVTALGRRHEVKEVAPGFARNFLWPRKLAQPATAANLLNLKNRARKIHEELDLKEELLGRQLADLETETVKISAKATLEGHLFAGLRAEDIVKVLAETKRLDIPAEALRLEKPIKTTGVFSVPVKLGEVSGMLKIEVIGEV